MFAFEKSLAVNDVQKCQDAASDGNTTDLDV